MAKNTYDVAGLSGAFSKDNMNNQFHSLYQGDCSPLRPRAQAAPNMTVAVASGIVESYYQQIWLTNTSPITYAGGNSPAISAPAANPRIDLLYLNSVGALAWITGTEAGAPAAPNFGLNGIPICYVYCKTTMTKIVNYEDTGANPNEGYIYKDIRPFQATAGSGAADDMIVRGFEIRNAVADDLLITINAGILYHDLIKISKTSNTTLTFATAANWWDGAVDSYAGGAGWCYVGVDSSGNIKLLGANPPNKADAFGNTDGTKFYWYDGVLYWRVIGAIRVDTDNKVHACGHIQNGSTIMFDVPQTLTTTVSDDAWTNGSTQALGDCSTIIPAITTLGKFEIFHSHTAADAEGGTSIRANGTTGQAPALGIGNVYVEYARSISGQVDCATDSSQKINHYDYGDNVIDEKAIKIRGYVLNIR